MKKNVKALWLEALRSGEYTQGKSMLRDESDKYCCLGVLCDVAVKQGVVPEPVLKVPEGEELKRYFYGLDDEENEAGVVPDSVRRWAGLHSANPFVYRDGKDSSRTSLSSLNDFQNFDFNMIADRIDADL